MVESLGDTVEVAYPLREFLPETVDLAPLVGLREFDIVGGRWYRSLDSTQVDYLHVGVVPLHSRRQTVAYVLRRGVGEREQALAAAIRVTE